VAPLKSTGYTESCFSSSEEIPQIVTIRFENGRIKPLCRFLIDGIHEVPIGIHGDVDRGMSYLASNVLGVLALGNQKAAKAMS